jgi:hypothetical protein
MVRNWEEAGKIPDSRHPVNNYILVLAAGPIWGGLPSREEGERREKLRQKAAAPPSRPSRKRPTARHASCWLPGSTTMETPTKATATTLN